MKLTEVTLLTIFAFTWQPLAQAGPKSRCPAEREDQMDQCASKIGFLGDHSFVVPKNVTAMEEYCGHLKDSIGCLQAYSRDCLQGFSKQLFTSLLRRGKQQYSLMCRDDQARKDFINKMSCLVDEKIGQFHSIMDASISRFEYIASDNVRSDSRLVSMCCSYHIFLRDVGNSLDKICGKPAQRRGSINEFIYKIVSGTAGEFFGLICDNHNSLDECRTSKKTNQVVGKLEEVTAKVYQGRISPKGKSLIPVMLRILNDSSGN